MTSPSEAPLSDLMDSFAMAAMEQLIAIYAPEKLESADETIQWCNHIAGMSYAMAGTMMNTRSKLHLEMIENAQKEEENAA
jgi:ABC-type Fe3+ transport system substrate-binding protein